MNNRQKQFLIKPLLIALLICLLTGVMAYTEKLASFSVSKTVLVSEPENEALSLYQSLDLEKLGLSSQAFSYAMKGYKISRKRSINE